MNFLMYFDALRLAGLNLDNYVNWRFGVRELLIWRWLGEWLYGNNQISRKKDSLDICEVFGVDDDGVIYFKDYLCFESARSCGDFEEWCLKRGFKGRCECR